MPTVTAWIFELEQGKILELAEAGAKHGDTTSLTVHVR
jgi:hypothetical protein